MVNVTGSDSELSPTSRQAVKSGKTEQIVTRSISAKEASDGHSQPLRSARLKQKAAAAAAAAASTEKMDTDEEPDVLDAENGNPDYKIVLDNRVDVLGLATTVSHSTDITHPLSINTKFALGSPGPGSSSTETASEVASFLGSPTVSAPNSAQCSPSVTPDKASCHESTPVVKMELEEKLARARELQVQLEANGKSKKVIDMSKTDYKTDTMEIDCDELNNKTSKGDGEKKADESPESNKNKSKFGSHQGFTPKVCFCFNFFCYEFQQYCKLLL